jgi:hypothetical protein
MVAGSNARIFFEQISGSLGVAAFVAISARRLDSVAAASGHGSINLTMVNGLSPMVRLKVFFAIANAVHSAFTLMVAIAIAAFVLSLFIKEEQLREWDTQDQAKLKESLRNVAPW